MVELICGFLSRAFDSESAGGASPEEIVHEMAASLGFGRPSALSVFADGPVALGRVAIASGNSPPPEPQLHRHGSIVATADMRLPASPDDAAAHETMFRAFTESGFPEALDGDFAVAIWDSDRGELTLARDRLGIRPLFIARTRTGGLAFASFPDALIASETLEGRFEPAVLAALVADSKPVGAKTWIEGVERIPPGHVMTIGREGERIRRYWRYPLDRPSAVPDDHGSAAKALRSELEAAVSRALPAHGRVCAHLSGGLDSGAVAALSSRLAGIPPAELVAYCITMPEEHSHLGPLDEEPAARSVARQEGVTLVTFPQDLVTVNLLRTLGRTFYIADSPNFVYRRIIEDAAARGAETIICGFGGDEVVSYTGEGALLADFLMLRWRALRRTARELSGPLWRALARQAAADLLPLRVERFIRRITGSAPLYNFVGERAIRPAFRPSPGWSPSVGAGRRQRARLEDHSFHHRLELQAWQAARHGVRYVFPLLDWRLVEFGAGLPARLQLHGGMRRALFRTAVADLLPSEVVANPRKLSPTASALYQLSVSRAELIAEARRVAESPAASAVVDLAEIERQLVALPEPETVARAMRAAVAEGLFFHDPRVGLIRPFTLARALAQNEADCARRSGTRPRAA